MPDTDHDNFVDPPHYHDGAADHDNCTPCDHGPYNVFDFIHAPHKHDDGTEYHDPIDHPTREVHHHSAADHDGDFRAADIHDLLHLGDIEHDHLDAFVFTVYAAIKGVGHTH